MNSFFYIFIGGTWRNSNSDSVTYQLIYACRFVAKLGVSLSPSQYTILEGQLLTIDVVV